MSGRVSRALWPNKGCSLLLHRHPNPNSTLTLTPTLTLTLTLTPTLTEDIITGAGGAGAVSK